MTDMPMLLIIGTRQATLKASEAVFASSGVEVVTSCSDYRELAKGIDSIKPTVVIIWDIDNADDILNFVLKWKNSDCRPFFIVTTCCSSIFNILDQSLPGYAFPILEPVSADFLRVLVQAAAKGKLDFS